MTLLQFTLAWFIATAFGLYRCQIKFDCKQWNESGKIPRDDLIVMDWFQIVAVIVISILSLFSPFAACLILPFWAAASAERLGQTIELQAIPYGGWSFFVNKMLRKAAPRMMALLLFTALVLLFKPTIVLSTVEFCLPLIHWLTLMLTCAYTMVFMGRVLRVKQRKAMEPAALPVSLEELPKPFTYEPEKAFRLICEAESAAPPLSYKPESWVHNNEESWVHNNEEFWRLYNSYLLARQKSS